MFRATLFMAIWKLQSLDFNTFEHFYFWSFLGNAWRACGVDWHVLLQAGLIFLLWQGGSMLMNTNLGQDL